MKSSPEVPRAIILVRTITLPPTVFDAHEVVGSRQQQIDEHDYGTRDNIIDYSFLTFLRQFTPFA